MTERARYRLHAWRRTRGSTTWVIQIILIRPCEVRQAALISIMAMESPAQSPRRGLYLSQLVPDGSRYGDEATSGLWGRLSA